MARILSKKASREALVGIALLLAITALIAYPTEALEGARDGLALCADVIIPSLFPFFVISNLIVDLGLARHLGRVMSPLMRPLFRLNGACATPFVLGFIGGYPVGARTAIALYESGQCSRVEAERMLAFCNNSGPAFIFGVVGAGVFGSSRFGILLYLVHITSSVLVGLMFRFYGRADGGHGGYALSKIETKPLTSAFTDAVKSGFLGTLNISAFVLLFAIIIRLLTESGALPALSALIGRWLMPLGVGEGWIHSFFVGLLELSSGVWTLSGMTELVPSLSMAAFMLGWAGFSVHCQTLSFMGKSGLSCRTYLLGKLLHGGLSAALVLLMARLLPDAVSVSAHLASQVETLALLEAPHAFTTALLTSFVVFVCFLLLAACTSQKKSGKRRRAVVK